MLRNHVTKTFVAVVKSSNISVAVLITAPAALLRAAFMKQEKQQEQQQQQVLEQQLRAALATLSEAAAVFL